MTNHFYVVQRSRGPIIRDSFATVNGRYTEEILAATRYPADYEAEARWLRDGGGPDLKVIEITIRAYQM